MTAVSPPARQLWRPHLTPPWRMVPLRYLLTRRITDGPHETPEFLSEGIPFLSVDAIQDGELTFARCRFISAARHAEFRKKAAPVRGDILFGKSASTGKIARVKTDVEFSIWSPLALLRPNTAICDPGFLEYALKSPGAQAQVDDLMTSNTQNNISMDAIPRIRVPLPHPEEQRAIADYLDREAARIDELLKAKQALLDLIAEKRKALIAHAVSRGIDRNAALRDSSVSWIGRVPAHWHTERCARLFRERDERAEPGLPLLEVSINSGVILREFADDRIESTAADFNTYKIARRGDLVFNKMRMWQGAVGIAPLDGLVSPDYTVAAIDGRLSGDYVGYLMRTEIFSAECARGSHGITWDRLRLYWEGFREIRIPLPPFEEQHAITGWVGAQTSKLDVLRAAAERTIALLKERRSALIAAAVTGQMDIREAA